LGAKYTTNFAVNRNPERPREFGGVQLPGEETFELHGHPAWQQIDARGHGRREGRDECKPSPTLCRGCR
jgi:hypothetical protein